MLGFSSGGGSGFGGMFGRPGGTSTGTKDMHVTLRGYGGSREESQSTEKRECADSRVVNSRGLRIMEQFSRHAPPQCYTCNHASLKYSVHIKCVVLSLRESELAASRGATEHHEISHTSLLSGVYATDTGKALQRGTTVHKRIKGFRNHFQRSKNFLESINFFRSTHGAFFVADAWCRHYKATLEKHTLPVFTENFIERASKRCVLHEIIT